MTIKEQALRNLIRRESYNIKERLSKEIQNELNSIHDEMKISYSNKTELLNKYNNLIKIYDQLRSKEYEEVEIDIIQTYISHIDLLAREPSTNWK
jgi:hypothetical protein